MKTVLIGPRIRQLRYQLNVRETRLRDQLVIDFFERDGEGPWRPLEVDDQALRRMPEAEDRAILQLLVGTSAEDRTRARLEQRVKYSRSVVRPGMYEVVLPRLAATGRFELEGGLAEIEVTGPLGFDEGGTFGFELVVERSAGEGYRLWGCLRRGDERIDLEAPLLFLSSGLFVLGQRVGVAEAGEAQELLWRLRRHGAIVVPEEAKDEFLVHLATMPSLPEVSLPPELHWSQVTVRPRPRIAFSAPEGEGERERVVLGRVSFDYGGQLVQAAERRRAVVDESGKKLFRRDLKAERELLDRLRVVGLEATSEKEAPRGEVKVPSRALVQVIRTLSDDGWHIESEGQAVRAPGALRTKINSGIDWFDLEAELEFDGIEASLPELLESVAQGARFVELKDGSRGIVPDWLTRYAQLAQTGKVEAGGRLRFLPSQAGILDALLTGQLTEDPNAPAVPVAESTVDVKFERIKKSLVRSGRVRSAEPPGFLGKLRDYQQEGLGWLRTLEAHQWNGCLADDMGLGKTVQVLAFLLGRHRPNGVRDESLGPTLIVVPRSLIHNWISEAARFAPDLKFVDYTGSARLQHQDRLREYDVVVTTYGTMRQDILHLLEIKFRTVVLDEAQAIKNPRSQAAKAARLLTADAKLAISGTPIENSLEELWSIFEFLNPGMLGPLEAFSQQLKLKDEAWLDTLATTLRPFMLRRTKEQVLTELPEKTQQTLLVELEDNERTRYDELRDFYRAGLQKRFGEIGFERAKIHVLEALLRLRQAACHPGLLDPDRSEEGSAKIDMLMEQLETLAATGHKALVFSQFTTLLKLVESRLLARGIGHEYLDGGTRDRQGGVQRFQTDAEKKVFLISLKAGGAGLNLTASDYVFILDPWWNPAVEAQAIDRAHRMGQKRPVFAYRLIAKDTVEEKIMQLKDEKQRLADAIISGDRSLMKSLTEKDILDLLG